MAGLAAAHELAERGFKVTVYERNALGGKARSIAVPGTGARRPQAAARRARLPLLPRLLPPRAGLDAAHPVRQEPQRRARQHGRRQRRQVPARQRPCRRRPFGLGPDPSPARRRRRTLRQFLTGRSDRARASRRRSCSSSSTALMVFLTSLRRAPLRPVGEHELVGLRQGRGQVRGVQDGHRRRPDAQPRRREGDGRQHAHDRQHGRGVRLQHHGPRQRRRARPRAQPADQRGVDRPVGHAAAQARRALPRRPRASTTLRVRGGRDRIGDAPSTATAAGTASRPTGSSARCRSSARASCSTRELLALDPASPGMHDLFYDWMAGIQYFLRERVDITQRPHHLHRRAVGADRADAGAVLGRPRLPARLRRRQGHRLAVGRHLQLGRARDPVRQAGQAVHAARRSRPRSGRRSAAQDGGRQAARRRSSTRWFLDPGDPAGTRARGRNTNETPLLVNTVGSWEKRPQARDEDPEPVPVPATTCRPTSTWRRWRAPTSPAAPRSTRCSTPSSSKAKRARCTSSTTRRSSRRPRPPTASSTGRACRTRSTSRVAAPSALTQIVVGARCAGAATAIALARAGRPVVALDRARFPSDTLSTHLLFAGGVAELQRARRAGAGARARRAAAARGDDDRRGMTVRGRLHAGRRDRLRAVRAAARGSTPRWWRPRARRAPSVRERRRVTRCAVGRRARGRRPLRDATGRARTARAAGRRRRRSALAGRALRRASPSRGRSNANGRACYFAYYDGPCGTRATSPRSGAQGASSAPRSRATAASCSCC